MLKNLFRSAVLLGALALCCPLAANTQNMILLKKGDPIPLENVISKDQFGIMVPAGKNPENGDILRRFIPFIDLNPASLTLFPFCDAKSAERIYTAVQDREVLIRKKFTKRAEDYQGTQDYTKNLRIHTGVDQYYIFFTATEATATGMVGFIYSEAPEALFYGKIFLYALLGKPGDIWIGYIYPTEKTIQVNGSTYTVFTVIPPEKKTFLDEMEEKENQEKKRRGPRGRQGRKNGPGQGPGQRNGTPPGR